VGGDEEMKRWDFAVGPSYPGSVEYVVNPSSDGAWVRWESVERLLSRCLALSEDRCIHESTAQQPVTEFGIRQPTPTCECSACEMRRALLDTVEA